MSESPYEPTLRMADLAPGRMRSFKVGEREILLCHTKDGVFALDNLCTHAFARLSEGYLKGTRLTCPLHAATFDVRDGRALGGPTRTPVATHPVRVVEGVIEVSLEAGPP